jgi:Ca2+-binding EF-hand superfamily protein
MLPKIKIYNHINDLMTLLGEKVLIPPYILDMCKAREITDYANLRRILKALILNNEQQVLHDIFQSIDINHQDINSGYFYPFDCHIKDKLEVEIALLSIEHGFNLNNKDYLGNNLFHHVLKHINSESLTDILMFISQFDEKYFFEKNNAGLIPFEEMYDLRASCEKIETEYRNMLTIKKEKKEIDKIIYNSPLKTVTKRL